MTEVDLFPLFWERVEPRNRANMTHDDVNKFRTSSWSLQEVK